MKLPRSEVDKTIDSRDITDAYQDFNEYSGCVEVRIEMGEEGTERWRQITSENIGKAVAIVIDNVVASAPIVQDEIAGGKAVILIGSATDEDVLGEAYLLTKLLNAQRLPVSIWIIDERLVY
jgi:preprotein translocase subunit SecD